MLVSEYPMCVIAENFSGPDDPFFVLKTTEFKVWLFDKLEIWIEEGTKLLLQPVDQVERRQLTTAEANDFFKQREGKTFWVEVSGQIEMYPAEQVTSDIVAMELPDGEKLLATPSFSLLANQVVILPDDPENVVEIEHLRFNRMKRSRK